MYVVFYLLIVYGLLRYLKQNSCDRGLLNPTGPLPVIPSQAILRAKAKSKFSPIKNLRDRHVHNSLLSVVIHMPCVNIHRAGDYQLEMVFLHAHLRTSDYNG